MGDFDPVNFGIFQDNTNPLFAQNDIAVRKFSDTSGETLVVLQKYLEELLAKSSGEFFRLYNLAFFSSAFFIDIRESSENGGPIFLKYNLPAGKNYLSPLTIIRVGKFSKSQIVEELTAENHEESVFINSLTGIFQEDSSSLTYVTTEKFNESVIHFRNLFSEEKKDSSLKNFYFNMGGYKGKTIVESDMAGTGGSVEAYGAGALVKREFLDTDIRINHNAGNTTSKLLVKIVAKEKAHHVFTGNLNIPIASEKVTANQMNKNLILNKTARAESIPKLEVFAHDVKCSHGATVGEIQDEEMFYLFSRGLKEDEARSLIVEGFLSEVLDKLKIESEKENIRNTIHRKLFGNAEIY